MINKNKTAHIHKIPFWQLKKKMKQLQFELELLQKDPSTNHNEIAEIDSKISKLKLEYASRRMKIEEKLKGVAK